MASKTAMERWTKVLSRDETARLVKLLAPVSRDGHVLDVGCGYGRKLDVLSRLGFKNLTGVERNQIVAESTRTRGYKVIASDLFDFEKEHEKYDCVVFSHIIEHFQHDDLLSFLDDYLDCLKPGGHAVILAPLPGAHFYLDFDHVKPYCPQSLTTVFGPGQRQIQERSRNVLCMEDVDFRRSPWRVRFNRALMLKTKAAFWPRFANLVFALLFKGSGKICGRSTGWLGLFSKQ